MESFSYSTVIGSIHFFVVAGLWVPIFLLTLGWEPCAVLSHGAPTHSSLMEESRPVGARFSDLLLCDQLEKNLLSCQAHVGDLLILISQIIGKNSTYSQS